MKIRRVHIVEVSPRDGLQNIPEFIPTEIKVALIGRLAGTGLLTIEIASVVSPKAVPQLADWRDVLGHRVGLGLPILLPNLKGLSLLLSHSPRPPIRSICVFISATAPFSHRNINCSVDDGLLRAREVTVAAKKAGIPRVRGYISCIFTDPITREPTDPSAVLHCTRFLLESGADEIALSDTDGSGTPGLTSSLLRYLLENGVPLDRLACHFHDTRGNGLENVWAAYEVGVRVFDGSVAGLGGCPFAPGARGNVDTVSLVKMFEENGVRTGVDLGLLDEVGKWVKGHRNATDLIRQPNREMKPRIRH
ncbi:hydroxymethylglutaryl-CoA lyase [Aspergillus foveolatus]|uniref:hydroxymethylglutaryl-CoA lyase n=1 Tax=Aspergillus foveolatus TaxID=210207 RepID=UPI003CCD94F8